jgi:endonuclease G, mitochondrial
MNMPRSRNFFLFLSFFLLVNKASAQRFYDTIIDKGIYKSYYSAGYKSPVAVTYTLFRGGGEVSRKGKHFVKDTRLPSHNAKDFHKSGYDEGHMANAEDFAYNDSLQELTFRFYNCVAQSPELNRGVWKKYESKARKLSQLDSLTVVCYNEFSDAPKAGLNVPAACYKCVYHFRTGKLLFEVGFQNSATPALIPIPGNIREKIEGLRKRSR